MAQSLDFHGEEAFTASAARVFALLTDLDALPRLMPDCESAERIDAETLRAVVRPGFSFLRGRLEVTLSLGDVAQSSGVAPSSATLRIQAKGIGIQMAVETHMEISPQDGGAKLAWQARVVELKGLVATISPALVKAAAEQVIRKTWDATRRELGAAGDSQSAGDKL